MPNPLKSLSGKRKYVFSKEISVNEEVRKEEFYLRVVTSSKEVSSCYSAMEMDCFVTYDAKAQLKEQLSKKGEELKEVPNIHSVKIMERAQKYFLESFDSQEGQTFFVLENQEGKPVCVMMIFIDNPHHRTILHIPKTVEQEGLVYVDDLYTHKEYRDNGLISLAFNEVISLLPSKPERSNRYVICMRTSKAVKGEEETSYVTHLPEYHGMWQGRFVADSVCGQLRTCYGGGAGMASDELMPLPQCLSQEEAKELTDAAEKAAPQRFEVLRLSGDREWRSPSNGTGMFLHGVSTPESEAKLQSEKAKKLADKKASFEALSTDWHEAPQWVAPENWRPCADYATFTHPRTKELIPVPKRIQSGEKTFTWKANKTLGCSIGGWYEDESGKEFLAKFGSTENLLNDLAVVCFGGNVVIQKTIVGHGLDTIHQQCILIENIQDYNLGVLIIGNDDLNEENLGLQLEDIGYLSVLDGVKKVVINKDEILQVCSKNRIEVLNNDLLNEAQKELYADKYSQFAKVLCRRIDWMEENLREDLAMIDDVKTREKFSRIKWSLHPKFSELAEYEDRLSEEKALVAETKIQRGFRAHKAQALAEDGRDKSVTTK